MRLDGILRGLGFTFAYSAWIAVFRLLSLTLITYFLMSSNTRFQDISDVTAANEIGLAGLTALGFLLALRFLSPLISLSTSEIINWQRLQKRFMPGFFNGAVLASGIVAACILSGLYRYLGFFIQAEDGPIALGNSLLRSGSLLLMVYCEEFLFRQRILSAFRRRIPDMAAALATSILYAAIKTTQFDLGVMQGFTLFLVGFSLAIRAMVDGDFARGAGFWAGLLLVFHPLLSLSVLGNDFQGLWLVKFEPGLLDDTSTSRFLTGGAGGPLSSFAFQLILLIEIFRVSLKNKNLLSKVRSSRLK